MGEERTSQVHPRRFILDSGAVCGHLGLCAGSTFARDLGCYSGWGCALRSELCCGFSVYSSFWAAQCCRLPQ